LAGVFVVRVTDPSNAEKVAAAIDAKFANSSDETKTQSEQEFQVSFARQLGNIGLIVNLITGMVFFSILFLTGVAMNQAVRERIPELAVLKCLGFKDRQVMWLVLSECFALCVIGATAGMLIASAAVQLPIIQSAIPVSVGGTVWLVAGACVIALTLLVGLPPAMTAQRLKIVDALAGRTGDSSFELALRKAIEWPAMGWRWVMGRSVRPAEADA
jgi:putative ABC transport system permease protein